MSWFEDSNIKKSYIVQTVSDVGIFSACTQIYLTNISPCVGDAINITGNLGVSGNISGTTYFGDGSQLSGIVTTDNFVTGGVYSASSETLYFTGTTGFTPFSVDVSALLDNTNNFVTGGTYNSSTDIVTLTRNDNVNINITGVSNTFTTGATYNEGTELITFVRNDGNSYTADLAAIASATTNSFTTGATLNGNIIEFANSVLGLNYYNVDLTPIVSGATNGYTTGATLNGNIIEFANNLLGLDYYNVDLTSLVSGFTTGNTLQEVLDNGATYVGDDILSITHSGATSETLLAKNRNAIIIQIKETGDTKSQIAIDKDEFTIQYPGYNSEYRINSDSWRLVSYNTTLESGENGLNFEHSLFGGGGTRGIDFREGNSIIITDSFSGTAGVVYAQDYSSTYSNRSLVDKEYVDNSVSGKVGTTLFNTYTGDTETALGSKLDTTTFNTYSGSVQTDLDTKLPTTTFNSYTGSVVDVFVSSGNANAGTQQLSFTNTTGGTFNVTNSASLFSDNDVNVTGGTYDTNTGCVTFITNSGTTFDVCGFVTGITDTFVTGGTLTGENLVLERSSGVDVGNIDLSGLVSGKLEISLFNTYTGDTQTALGNKTDNTNFVSHTGDTTIHYTKGSINLSELGSSAHTHSISEVVNLQTELDAKVATTLFNTYTGDTETALGNKVATTLFNTYTGDTETALGTKTTNTNFTSHTGDTTIHYTKGSINLSDLGSSAHTHSISEVINLQNNLDAKVATTLFNTYTGDTETALGNKLATTTFNSYTGSVVDVFVSSGNVNAGAQQLSFTNTTGGTFNVTNASALFSDNDVNVTGGTYNINTGCVTFITNSATTFDVCGFVTGITDTFVTGGTLSGDNLVLERSSGVDVGNIDLSGLISNSALVGSYLDERVARWNSTTNTLQNGLIRDDGTTTSIGNGPSASNLFYVDNTSLTTSILGQTQDGNSNQTHSIRAINKNGSANNNTYATGILAESIPTGTPSDGIYTAGRFIQGNFSEYSSASQLELTALQIQVDTTTGSDELHGINFDKFDINDAVSGNAYAIKIGGFTGAGVVSGTKYGIYQSGSEKNYFGGQLQLNSVGAATPVTNLGVDASGYIVSGTTGASEIGELSDAIYLSANENLGLGDGALVSVTTGAGDQRNVAVGNDAGNKWSGGYSVFIGSKAGDNAVTGNYNVAIGADALGNAASCNTSIAIGSSALAGSTGVGNIGIGNSAGSSITSGGRNIFIGRNANGLNTSSYQIAIGDLSTTQASSLALGRSGIILLHGEFATAGRTKLGVNLGNTYSAPTANLQVKGNASDTTTFLVENGSGSSIFQVDEDGTITGNGLGDVSKVGTPVNNQIGVWTGDGTIEGDSNLIWGGSTLQVGNSINSNISQVTSTYLASKVETNDANLLLYGYGDNGTNSGEILLAQARGTIDSPTSTQSGDILGDIGFMGATGAPAHREAARIRVFAGENFVDGTNYGSTMKFSTSTIGNATVTDRYVIDGSGEHNFTGNVNITSGLLNLANTTSGTPVTNLAVDSSGNVVEASDSVSDQNKIFSWFMNVS
ncbi:hypothetical protein N9994_00075 [bacterium]|nr:hypothetical protein [bacterium]